MWNWVFLFTLYNHEFFYKFIISIHTQFSNLQNIISVTLLFLYLFKNMCCDGDGMVWWWRRQGVVKMTRDKAHEHCSRLLSLYWVAFILKWNFVRLKTLIHNKSEGCFCHHQCAECYSFLTQRRKTVIDIVRIWFLKMIRRVCSMHDTGNWPSNTTHYNTQTLTSPSKRQSLALPVQNTDVTHKNPFKKEN